MTVEEKASVVSGQTSTVNGCSGMIPGVPRLGFPGICVQDGPNGLHGVEAVNGYAFAISVGAAWNKELAHKRGLHMGMEAKKKGGQSTILFLGLVVSGFTKLSVYSQQLDRANNRPPWPHSFGWSKLGMCNVRILLAQYSQCCRSHSQSIRIFVELWVPKQYSVYKRTSSPQQNTSSSTSKKPTANRACLVLETPPYLQL